MLEIIYALNVSAQFATINPLWVVRVNTRTLGLSAETRGFRDIRPSTYVKGWGLALLYYCCRFNGPDFLFARGTLKGALFLRH